MSSESTKAEGQASVEQLKEELKQLEKEVERLVIDETAKGTKAESQASVQQLTKHVEQAMEELAKTTDEHKQLAKEMEQLEAKLNLGSVRNNGYTPLEIGCNDGVYVRTGEHTRVKLANVIFKAGVDLVFQKADEEVYAYGG